MKRTFILWILFAGLGVLPMLGQSLNMKLGLFFPDQNSDLWQINRENLIFNKADMIQMYSAIEFEQYMNRNLSFTIQGSYYKKEHFSKYRDYEYEDDSPIYQNLSLEITGLEMGFKLYPAGHRSTFLPYLGLSAGLYHWEYRQWGDFINFDDLSISENENAETSSYTLGLNAKAGLINRFNRHMGIGIEASYQYAQGHLSSFFEDFEPFDLSGFSANVGLYFYFN